MKKLLVLMVLMSLAQPAIAAKGVLSAEGLDLLRNKIVPILISENYCTKAGDCYSRKVVTASGSDDGTLTMNFNGVISQRVARKILLEVLASEAKVRSLTFYKSTAFKDGPFLGRPLFKFTDNTWN
ncbi:hypothetical protein [Parachitinimonas caeni]|uniref:Uncharacterized protein n=1 Tax=Parachitinimonas caeni TaxID=3031301 RepID=A0ABT7E7Z8_9NEIS|nr:hypothetical protein [Parachitinimonas caeni]MDK2127032.1 hypothetical protein [Parachitinimonas caeni]